MSELAFKRPGGIEIQVSRCAQGYIYVVVWQLAKKAWRHLVTVNTVRPTECRLFDYGDSWVLSVRDARIHLKQVELRQVSELFGAPIEQVFSEAQS